MHRRMTKWLLNDEVGGIWEEVTVANFVVFFWYLLGRFEEYYEGLDLEKSMLPLRFETGTSEIQVRNLTT
jgi:hypothetical protein